MAYSRTNSDIRTVALPKSLSIQNEVILTLSAKTPLHSQPNIKREFAKVMLCTLPLIGLLVIATYLDSTDRWVLNLAEKVLTLGS